MFGGDDSGFTEILELNKDMKKIIKEMDQQMTGNKRNENQEAKKANDAADRIVNAPKRSASIDKLSSKGNTNSGKVENKFVAKS